MTMWGYTTTSLNGNTGTKISDSFIFNASMNGIKRALAVIMGMLFQIATMKWY
jgi:hypothetical protein